MSAVSETSAFRLAAWITAINVLVASGFAIAGLVAPQAILPPGAAPGEASSVFALYAAARSLPLAAFALWAIARRNVRALIVLGALAGVVQLFDAGVGLVQHDLGKTIGPLVIAALQAFATFRTRRRVRRLARVKGRTRLSNRLFERASCGGAGGTWNPPEELFNNPKVGYFTPQIFL